MRKITTLLYSTLLTSSLYATADTNITYKNIEWPELMSAEDLAAIEAMPAIDHGDENINFDNNSDAWQDDNWEEDTGDLGDASSDNVSSVVANAINNAMIIRDKPDVAKAYDAALVSTKTRPEFNNSHIRLAGFVVPLEFDDNQVISEFFLVPYFGACIHLPPPPPNQIIHITLDNKVMNKGFNLQQLYEPVWVSGQLKTQLLENSMATSAYSMSAHNITPYTEDEYSE